MQFDTLFINATLLDRQGEEKKAHALGIQDGKITWVGSMDILPTMALSNALVVEDCEEALITPGLIDCHTHVVYAGNRADEFKQRLEGATYADIAKRGGGILSTVRKTREASEEALYAESLPRLLAMRAQGVTTIEIKSGYGLDMASEIKMLRVARQLGRDTGIRVLTTFLGAHTIPPEYAGRRQAYIDYLCDELIPMVAEEKLADAVDVFTESIAFTIAETEQLFRKAYALGLPIKCHADQLSNIGASALAARYSALSCDHLEYATEASIAMMAKANSVAVLLPGAYYFLKETQKPPVAQLREAGVGIAIATDCNPGSSPTTSLLLMMQMACQWFSLTIPEVWSAVTYQAARALGIAETVGALEIGLSADLIRWPVHDSALLCYYFGHFWENRTMIAGEWQ